jgi:glycosyltransferase involved in cell wall biosynthesis
MPSGAERVVHDLMVACSYTNMLVNLFVLNDCTPRFEPNQASSAYRVFWLGGLATNEKLRKVVLETLASTTPVVYTNLPEPSDCAQLWSAGIRTIPIIHNARPGWPHSNTELADPERTPFVITVWDSVAQQLGELAAIPVHVIPHEQINAVQRFRRLPRGGPANPPPVPDLVPRLWSWIANYGIQAINDEQRDTVLFLTMNLNPGGPQRSLVNLLNHVPLSYPKYLCIFGEAHCDFYLDLLDKARVSTFSLEANGSVDRVEQVLSLIDRLRIGSICFWNVNAHQKLLLSKILLYRHVRLIDVSPGPMLFDELDAAEPFARRISFDRLAYLGRLDAFVTKYHGGGIPERYGARNTKTVVIPNGVPRFKKDEALDAAEASPKVRPAWADPSLAVVTCCRIVPNKRLESLLEMAVELRRRVPGATLTIVGGVDPRRIPYWKILTRKHRELKLSGTVHFAGPNADVFSFLQEFRAFVMLSSSQGCPNASLEAMAAGLPVVANDDGGTAEQVEDGRTGFLVPGDDPKDVAERLEKLLRDPGLARRLGDAGREKVLLRHSMANMVENYVKLLWPELVGGTSPKYLGDGI